MLDGHNKALSDSLELTKTLNMNILFKQEIHEIINKEEVSCDIKIWLHCAFHFVNLLRHLQNNHALSNKAITVFFFNQKF